MTRCALLPKLVVATCRGNADNAEIWRVTPWMVFGRPTALPWMAISISTAMQHTTGAAMEWRGTCLFAVIGTDFLVYSKRNWFSNYLSS